MRTREIYDDVVEENIQGFGMLSYKNTPVNPPYHQMNVLPVSWDTFYAFMNAWFLLDYRWPMDDEECAKEAVRRYGETVKDGIIYG